MSGLVTLPSLMNSSLTSGVPSGTPRLAVTRLPTGPCNDLSLAWWEPLGWEHHGPDSSIWLGQAFVLALAQQSQDDVARRWG